VSSTKINNADFEARQVCPRIRLTSCVPLATASDTQTANRKSTLPTRAQYKIHGRKPGTKPIAYLSLLTV